MDFLTSCCESEVSKPLIYVNSVYCRLWSSKNCRESPFSIEILLLDEQGNPIHQKHSEYILDIMRCIYLWDPDDWSDSLRDDPDRGTILRTKSDFFWESLAQQVAERIFNTTVTSSVYLFGPAFHNNNLRCAKNEVLVDAYRLIVKTKIESGMDPLNPNARTITYITTADNLFHPEIFLEVHLPTNVEVKVSPYRELLDMRPAIQGSRLSHSSYVLRAHIPPVQKRTQNIDYPDFCLFFIPCRHFVFQGHVDNPRTISKEDGIPYKSLEECLDKFEEVIEKLRCQPGSIEMAAEVAPFITSKYYYPYDDYEGDDTNNSHANGVFGIDQFPVVSEVKKSSSLTTEESRSSLSDDEDLPVKGLPHFCVEKFDLAKFREYILGDSFGIGRGLARDFDCIQLCVDGTITRTVQL